MTRIFLILTGKMHDAKSRLTDERGASAVEYGMLVALIAAVVVATVALLGPKIRDAFQAIVDALTANGV